MTGITKAILTASERQGDSPETAQIVVSRINGCWKVDPFTPMMLVPTVHDPDEQTT